MADIVQVRPKRVTPELAKAVAGKGTIEGNRVLQWWNKQSATLQQNFARSVRQSMMNGETLQQAVTRVVGGTVAGVQVNGIMKASRAQASALVATSMNHATNQARLATYQKNTDVVKAIQQVSTLDNRTSEVCIAYSGLVWDAKTLEPIDHDLPFNGGPPRHFNCRSTLIPVTKSFKELGVDVAEVPPGQRASMDGVVPADITFDEWLRGKSQAFQDDLLGARKAELWRQEKITLQQLVDFRGEPVSADDLQKYLQKRGAPADLAAWLKAQPAVQMTGALTAGAPAVRVPFRLAVAKSAFDTAPNRDKVGIADSTLERVNAVTAAQIQEAPTESVRLDTLLTLQAAVKRDTLQNPALGNANGLPVVVRIGTREFLIDGNHRATKAWAEGKRSIRVRVVTL